MSTRGWESVSRADLAKLGAQPVAQPSKYRNVKVTVDGITFDSKREAGHYQQLKARQACGEIRDLQLQVRFPLHCPIMLNGQATGASAVIAHYVADFTWIYAGSGELTVADSKGKRTRDYLLKRKWMAAEYGIEISEL